MTRDDGIMYKLRVHLLPGPGHTEPALCPGLCPRPLPVWGGAAQQVGEVSLLCGHPGHQLARAAEEEAGPGEEDSVNKVGSGDSANAVPHKQKLRVRVTHVWGNRRGQPNRSAMERPRPRGTAFMITVNLHAR